MTVMPSHAADGHFHGRGLDLAIISIVFVCLAAALVVSRISWRIHINSRLVLSDYAISLSVLFSIGLTICLCIAVQYGVGKLSTTLSTHDLHQALRAFWIAQILYKFTINLTKLSICLIYLQIFPGRIFRIATYVVISYVLSYAIASIVATVTQCLPVERVWNKKIPGHCINLTAFWYANAIANIIGDCIIYILPVRPTLNLKIPKRQKYGLIIVFVLGAFVCVTSVLRMTTLKTGSRTRDDPTYGILGSMIWTTIEANTGIVCACLPMLRAPIQALFPRLFPTDYSLSGRRTRDSLGTGPDASRTSHRLPSADLTSPSGQTKIDEGGPRFSSPLSPSGGRYIPYTSSETRMSPSTAARVGISRKGLARSPGDSIHIVNDDEITGYTRDIELDSIQCPIGKPAPFQ